MDKTWFSRMERGRPRGRRHDETVHVRLPGPTLEALRVVAAEAKVSVSQIIRCGIHAWLGNVVPGQVGMARDERASGWKRMKAAKLLRLIAYAAISLGPKGLELAYVKGVETIIEEITFHSLN